LSSTWRAAPDVARAPASAEIIDQLLNVLGQTAKLALLHGNTLEARARLDEAAQVRLTPEQTSAVPAARWLELALLQWWVGSAGATAELRARAEAALQRVQALGAPVQPELMLRYAVLSGQREQAERWLGQMTEVERRHPFVRHFCTATRQCAVDTMAARAS
jgi:hypothetical protein